MEIRRTAPVKLVVPDDRHETAGQFLHCANRASEFCWSDDSYTECVTRSDRKPTPSGVGDYQPTVVVNTTSIRGRCGFSG